ncbi:hypothetical protein [Streptomyces sp. NBC_00328]|nr:hypothetical protein [Streptomyces sp. NBC_00328]
MKTEAPGGSPPPGATDSVPAGRHGLRADGHVFAGALPVTR